ncbi:ATP synthase F0F1 subunit gamma [Sphingomonas sp. Leaf33]|uniref:F0F1 ATP synthase subunit gamma n=1 Tax=Sphingomonas sp. Leaf33 TaxID=1736215 RepID=UPI0006FC3C0D|nr:F0F1 ATP synthase subunit gamma [Sphingomonas sp. Leaf33]KQN25649.1 ATP synthase F0F1 subunit gamma [Sphingomonas sp. Leaf33]
MASLKALKIRINSVKSTQKITKAMKMVAAAKLRRAQDTAEAGRPYAQTLERVVASLVSKNKGASPLIAGTGKDQVHLFVVATSDRGLAGAFNTNIARLARREADKLIAQGKTVKFYTIGRKGRNALNRLYRDRMVHGIEPGDLGKLTFADAKGYADDLIRRFKEGEFDVAHLFYSTFKSVLTQEPTEQQILPVKVPASAPIVADSGMAVVEYEPDEESILEELLPRNVAIQLFRAMRENAASEQGSKMTAMDNATRNAGDLIKRLTTEYNRTRQAAITTELVEIISGAEAL